MEYTEQWIKTAAIAIRKLSRIAILVNPTTPKTFSDILLYTNPNYSLRFYLD